MTKHPVTACLAAASLSASSLFVPPPVTAANVTFFDIQGHWAQLCIEELAERGVLEGYAEGTFEPDAPLNRAEFSAFVQRAFPDADREREEVQFFDVPADFWAFDAIRFAQQRGFLSGYPDNQFKPKQEITRAQALVALANGLDYSTENLSLRQVRDIYEDARQIPDYALSGVAAATENGIVVNYPNVRLLKPEETTTRAEAATFICRALRDPQEVPVVPIQYIAEIPTLQQRKTEAREVQGGAIRAELSYEKENYIYRDMRLQITRAGEVMVDTPLNIDGGINRVIGFQVRDLDGDRDPEVLVDLFARGNRCCSTSLIYRYVAPQDRYVALEQDWGFAAHQLKDFNNDGLPEFDSGDSEFALNFVSSGEDAVFPPQIWQFRQGQMFDVTRQFPNVIQSSADRFWEEYQERVESERNPKGALAAYLATQYLLGRGSEGWRKVQGAYDGSDRQAFFDRLQSVLLGMGYPR